MSIAPDSQKLKINSAGLPNGFFIRGAVLVVVTANGSVRDMDIAGFDVDVSEEIFMHEMMKALRMRGGKAEVFIEIKGDDTRKIKSALFMECYKMFVNADHCVAGGQAQRQ